jgi:hypothetical protein
LGFFASFTFISSTQLVFADTQAKGYTLKSAYIERGPTVAFQVLPSEK